MRKIKIMIVFGTRPEAIKMCPLIYELKKYPNNFDVTTCVTGQHREMLDQVLEIFDVKPDVDLKLMSAGQDLVDIFGSAMAKLRDVYKAINPDLVLVHGDTLTALAASMSAFYSGIEVGHVEAGLRTYNVKSPFPEEFQRQVISKIAKFHFAPTIQGEANLIREGVNKQNIFVTGNTVIDALMLSISKLDQNPFKRENIELKICKTLGFNYKESKFILITGHRRESFGVGFQNISKAIKKLAKKYKNIKFVYPVHLNPRVRDAISSLSREENVHLLEPLNYEEFILLLRECYFVITDSGGIQEEAPSLGKPVVLMRDTTERPEAIEANTVLLVGANSEKIFNAVSNLINNNNLYTQMSTAHNPYGDGNACQIIADRIRCEYA